MKECRLMNKLTDKYQKNKHTTLILTIILIINVIFLSYKILFPEAEDNEWTKTTAYVTNVYQNNQNYNYTIEYKTKENLIKQDKIHPKKIKEGNYEILYEQKKPINFKFYKDLQ